MSCLDMVEETVTISIAEYNSLLGSERILNALEAAGVDNWEWYGVALEEFWDEEDDD